MRKESDITQLLQRFDSGDAKARDAVFTAVYDELRRIARGYMFRERADHTLQATGLVNEAYLKLVDQTNITWQNRSHFYGVAAQMMRRILVDYARARNAGKRGGGVAPVSLDEQIVFSPEKSREVLKLNDSLDQLEQIYPDVARVIMLKFFAGLHTREIAELMNLSERTIKRRWQFGRAWLLLDLEGGGALPTPSKFDYRKQDSDSGNELH